MRYRGVIFDLDGVLCSTDALHYRAWKRIADRIGAPFTEKDNDRLRGVSRMESLEILLERYEGAPLTQADKQALAEEKNKYYRESLMSLTPRDLLPQALETLAALKEAGVKLAIGSSSRNTPLILERLELGEYFDAVADGNRITHSKPHPEVFLLAADMLGLSPSECVVVEDAAAGIAAAHAGGFKSAGLGEAANDSLCDYPLRALGELTSIVQG